MESSVNYPKNSLFIFNSSSICNHPSVMKKLLPLILPSLMVLSSSLYGQRQPPPGPPPGGGRPPRGERPHRRIEQQPGANEQEQRRRPRGQRGGGPRPENLTESDAELGTAGIAWYPILEDGLAEARRTNKPILFMAVASQCGGIPGVF